ncbi:hypothetical protein [Burkholderia sp. BCC0405]|uniref:hypothetical protein n=1 Tax=Burkholderia sp. BCC0405 TaxID=2676298 RepID=UPI001588CF6C|nr:hypothetical protein [Burkholderia sp. BCC0405]
MTAREPQPCRRSGTIKAVRRHAEGAEKPCRNAHSIALARSGWPTRRLRRTGSQRIDSRANALLDDKNIYNRRDASQA